MTQPMAWTTAQQESLLNTIQRRNERAILQNQLVQTNAEVEKRQQEQALLRDQWQQEQADVDRLNRLSWASLYYDLLNRRDQQISQEEAEAQQARLRYEVVAGAVTDLQHQRDSQAKRLAQYATADADYEQLLQAKRTALYGRYDATSETYRNHLATLTQHNQYLQELAEAHRAGLRALDEVMHLRNLLDQSRNWGTLDMLGGSAFSSLVKYRKLDDVQEQSYRVTRSLEQFRVEYADLNQRFMADWNFDNNLTRFVDIFFDNIFTDWSVQSRINNARKTAQDLENRLITTLAVLKSQIEQSVEQTKQQANELQRFLESA